jgi:hypothetical protein
MKMKAKFKKTIKKLRPEKPVAFKIQNGEEVLGI